MVKDKHVRLWKLGRNIETIKKPNNLIPHLIKHVWEGKIRLLDFFVIKIRLLDFLNKIINFGINDKNNVDKTIL